MQPVLPIATLASALFALAGTALAQQALPDLGSSDGESREKSYAIPAAEIVGFQFLLNRVDHWIYGADYAVTAGAIKRQLRPPRGVGGDPHKINQPPHPPPGSMYHRPSRSPRPPLLEAMGCYLSGRARR